MTNKRNLQLSERDEGTREKKCIKVIDLNLDDIFKQFKENIKAIRYKFEIADKLLKANSVESCEDIWRSQIVFLDSALDYYMHCITKYGMNKMFNCEWSKTEKYNNFMIPLKDVEHALKNREDDTWFIRLINNSYANDTFMNSSSIKGQLNLLGLNFNSVAEESFYEQGSEEKPNDKFKKTLNTLFNRRNFIAHQSDRFHENGKKKKVTKEEVENYIIEVEKIINSIQNQIEKKNSTD